jgi:hypothetical protein
LFGAVVVLPAPVVVVVVGLPVILSKINFVPAPIAAPVSAFTTLLVVEFGLLTFGLTVGLTTDVGDVVFVVGVVDVLFVIAGVVTFGVVVVVFVAGVVTLGVVVDVSVGLVVKGVLGASVVLGTALVFVVKDAGGLVGKVGFVDGAVTVEVIGGRVATPLEVTGPVGRAPEPSEVIEPEVRPSNEGRLLKSRITLPNGARSIPLASGICLLDVRFFRIAMSYPVFFSNEIKPAILVTGVSFAVLASVLGAAVGAVF